MRYTFEIMTQEQAQDIAQNWRYEGEYSFYDLDADLEDLEEFLDPEKRADSYFMVFQENKAAGFYSFAQTDKETVDIGLGMKPDLTGRGKGIVFLEAGLQFAKTNYQPQKITLSVAAFNKRAIKVYQSLGFRKVESFVQATNGGHFDFVKMELDV